MMGVDIINSTHMAKGNVNITLVDFDKARLEKVESY